MSRNDDEQPQYLQLSSRTLRFGSRIYQLKNITNVAMFKIRPTYIVSIKGFIISGILFFVLMSIDAEIARIIGLISLVIFVGGIAERFMKKPDYALHLETNAGSQRLISSSDKDFIQKIIGQIYSFMDDETLDAKYVFNLEDKSVRLEDRSIRVDGNVSRSNFVTGNDNFL